MPGLSQLKKFNSDILSLGNEAELRAQRGEKVVSVPIPRNVKDVDDSNDFVMGISDLVVEPSAENKNINADEDFSDITGTSAASTAAEQPAVSPVNVNVPDLSSLVNQTAAGAGSSDSIPDLSMFMEDELPSPEETLEPEEEKEPDIADLSLDDLLGDAVDFEENQNGAENESEKTSAPPEEPAPAEIFDSNENISDMTNLNSGRSDQAIDMSVLQNPEQNNSEEIDSIPSLEDAIAAETEDKNKSAENIQNSEKIPLNDIENLAPLPEDKASANDTKSFDLDELGDLDEFTPQSDDIQPGQMFSLDDLEDLSENAPTEQPLSETDDLKSENPPDDISEENAGDDIKLDDIAFDGDSIDNIDDTDDFIETSENQNTETEPDNAEIQPGQMFSLDDFDSLAETPEIPENAEPYPSTEDLNDVQAESPKSGIDFSDFDLPEANTIDLGSESKEFDDFEPAEPAESSADNNLDTEEDSSEGTPKGLFDSADMEMPDIDSVGTGTEDLPEVPEDDFNSAEEASAPNEQDVSDVPVSSDVPENDSATDLSSPSDDSSLFVGIPDDENDFSSINFDDASNDSFGLDDGSFDLGDIPSEQDGQSADLQDFDAGTEDNSGSTENISESPSFEDIQSDETPSESNAADTPANETSKDNEDFPESDDFPADFDFDLNDSSDGDNIDTSADESMPIETFDTSELAGMEFPDTDTQLSGGDFELDDADNVKIDTGDFEIRGFTDVDTVAEGKNGKMKMPEPEIRVDSDDGTLPENTLSDEDYKKFLKNLSSYPLNVRLAVEDLIIKNEFTDEAEFEIVQKVLKKVSARQLASDLEKMLDISIPVPRDFERRTAAEYEAYKASFQYQLRNKIIPGALMSLIGALLVWLVFMFSKFYIYEPAMANHLYKQGYNLLEAENYPQSEEKFNEAVKYNLQKKWFFKYAHGYRDHKQYVRAEQMYVGILRTFKFDKTAGLEYAQMELDDLANYSKAEEVVLRDILDHHVNDPDGILLLGDIYLEWATEKDASKFPLARARYSDLVETNKVKSKSLFYLSRMLRYYIRTDNLLEVLQLKDNFMPKAKSLGAQDWTELSGYLLDKLYDTLAPSDEYLRSKIEDVKETLVRAIKADENNPVAFYNMSHYYVHMKDRNRAKEYLHHTIKLFDEARSVKKRDVYKNINAYRLLGEEYKNEHEYLKALEAYTGGISLFTAQHEGSGLEGNEQVGKLYGDIGDIEYFISGDNESALLNYKDAVDNFYDTPKIRYKIGYIQYGKKNYSEALGSFMKASEEESSDINLLLAMGNTLSMRDDNYAAQGYYERLIDHLDAERAQKGIMFPQTRSEDGEIVDLYLKASNNLGVTLYRLARRTGNSSLNAQAMVNFQESMRAWDALTRNQTTMIRLGGSNLAEQNMKYVSHPMPDYEPEIYTGLPRTLNGEEEFGR